MHIDLRIGIDLSRHRVYIELGRSRQIPENQQGGMKKSLIIVQIGRRISQIAGFAF